MKVVLEYFLSNAEVVNGLLHFFFFFCFVCLLI